jgi:hypothetical protein
VLSGRDPDRCPARPGVDAPRAARVAVGPGTPDRNPKSGTRFAAAVHTTTQLTRDHNTSVLDGSAISLIWLRREF